jgi:pimeloyl-ACP methyl ester carboxylesterase
VLSVVGRQTHPLFDDSHTLLKSWFPQLEESVIDDAGHLLQLQQPTLVASSIGTWLGDHAMYGTTFARAPLVVRAP